MIINTILITSLIFSFAVRSSVLPEKSPDYEARTGLGFEVKDSKYKIKGECDILYEREVGLFGYGHDLDISYTKQDKLVYALFGSNLTYKRHLRSYGRDVKDLNYQTLDTGYALNNVFAIGYTVSFERLREVDVLYYSRINSKYITLDLSVNAHKVISTLKVQYKFVRLVYKSYDGKDDYFVKFIFKIK